MNSNPLCCGPPEILHILSGPAESQHRSVFGTTSDMLIEPLLQRGAALRPAAVWGLRSRALQGVPYSAMSIGVPKETAPREKRVAQTPESVAKLVKEGFTVKVESGAGAAADFNDEAYKAAGAVLGSRDDAFGASLVTKVMPPTPDEAKLIGDRMLLSFLFPAQNDALVKQLQAQKATAFAMDCIPRTLSRGQAFDALSSQVVFKPPPLPPRVLELAL